MARYRATGEQVRVHSGTEGPGAIRVRLRDLSPAHQAALLRLDPVADSVEYAELVALIEDENVRTLEDLARGPAGTKMELAVLTTSAWTDGAYGPGLRGVRSPRSSTMTRPSLRRRGSGVAVHREEQSVVAGAVLERLWRKMRTARARCHRDRRGSQHLPRGGRRPTHGPVHRGRDPDRLGGTQVRPLPDRCDPAAAEGSRERHLSVRQPRPDADELNRRSRARDAGVLVRTARPDRPGHDLRAGRGAYRRHGRIAPGIDQYGSRITPEGGSDVAGWACSCTPAATVG